ncbi:MAG TPA: cytochrome P450 [Burkholderiaceae bacterium]|nr:cytochrome P450 [Burkholderiaceae bacterium]
MDMPVSHASDIDLFTDEALADPYPLYRALRDVGPAAWLNRHDVWFIGRHDSVRAALGDWQTWSSAGGVGLNPTINEAWKNALICVDPPVHTQMRTLITDRLGPRQLEGVQKTIVQRAERLASRIAAQRDFEAVTDVAHDLPIGVIMDLIGWPEDVRGGLLELAAGSFDACGPDNPRMRAALPRLEAMMAFIADTYDRGRLAEGGFGWTIADAARRGEIPREAAIGMLAGYVVAAFDTTIAAIANGLFRFAENPAQWERLRAEPALLPSAFNEIVRIDTPIQGFARVATRDVDMGGGVVVPEGSRAIVSYASASRDERRFPDPDRFDIGRRPLDHLGFGLGVHGCAGQSLARLEAHAVFGALARHVTRFELLEPPQRALNNVIRCHARIRMRAHA